MDLARFQQRPLLGILRGGAIDQVAPLVDCVVAAGLEAFEITMNTENAVAMIERLRLHAGDRLMVGAGTVLNREQVQRARDAGATFIVSPILVEEVVDACVGAGVPVFPGAFTPAEIYAAARAGATMVKLFPAKAVGPGYIKEIRGPFADVEILACGGVSAENVADYFAAGAGAVAVGGSVFRPDWLASGAYARIAAELARIVTAVVRSHRHGAAGQ